MNKHRGCENTRTYPVSAVEIWMKFYALTAFVQSLIMPSHCNFAIYSIGVSWRIACLLVQVSPSQHDWSPHRFMLGMDLTEMLRYALMAEVNHMLLA